MTFICPGRPVSLVFDSASRLFNYTYRPDPTITLPTELFVPPLVYTEGFLVDLSEGLSWTPDETHKNRQVMGQVDQCTF